MSSRDQSLESAIRQQAEKRVRAEFKGKFFQKIWFNYVLSKTRDLVSSRENLRYDRTRGFGMVRKCLPQLEKN